MTEQNQNQPESKLTFPIKGVDACPHCGSTERLGQKILQQFKVEGKIPRNSYPSENFMLPMILQAALDGSIPLGINPTLPMLQVCWDVCKECKTMYCREIQLASVPIQLKMPPPPRR